MNKTLWAALAAGAALLAQPALADVKAGVDAWARGDYARAIEEWRGPAAAGDADAQFNLGQAYKLGRGVPADLTIAEQWYRAAALQGHPQAEDNFGLALYQNGKKTEAVPWLRKSSNRGEPRAQFVLGTMYFNGEGVEKDWVRAYALILRAGAAGLPQAQQTQAQMERYIALPDRQEGIKLAGLYERDEARARGVQLAQAPGRQEVGTIGTTELPPSAAYREEPAQPTLVEAAPPPAATPPAPVEVARPRPQPKPPAPKPTPPPVETAAAPPPPRPAPAQAAPSGGWRVQLGAFGDPANARKLWGQVSGKFPGRQPYYVKAGRLLKLLVGPYASRGEAASACSTVKPCIPVAP